LNPLGATGWGGARGPLCQAIPRLRPHGLRTDGGVLPPYDHHQGTPGQTAGDGPTSMLANIASYLAAVTNNKLDLVILGIGTNVGTSGAQDASDTVSIMTAIWAAYPQCKILVLRIGYFGESTLLANAALTLAAITAAFPGDPRWGWVVTPIMDQHTPFSDYWSGDGVHPKGGGYRRIWNAILQALIAIGMGP
jgi:lysophospholipase L1-like esterase